jgi:hypothetical protein
MARARALAAPLCPLVGYHATFRPVTRCGLHDSEDTGNSGGSQKSGVTKLRSPTVVIIVPFL